jgi:oligopeptidase B
MTRAPPIAKKVAHVRTIHNTEIQDVYSWMRGKDWPKRINEKDILTHLTRENQYYDRLMSPLVDEKELIVSELKGRMQLTDQSTYIKSDDYYYYFRTEAHLEYGLYCRKHDSTQNQEEIILDVNKLAESRPYIAIGAFSMCPRHALVAYSADFTGGETFTIYVVDVKNQIRLPDAIPKTIGDVVWHEVEHGFFYTPCDENWRRSRVMFHSVGTNSDEDRLVYQEADVTYSVSLSKTSSRKYLVIRVGGYDCSESHYIPMDDERLRPILVRKRAAKHFYSIDHGTSDFFMLTNKGTPHFCILRCAQRPSMITKSWSEYINKDATRHLLGFTLTKKYMLLNYRRHGLPLIVVRDLKTGEERNIVFADESYAASGYSTNFDDSDLRIDYSSLRRPDTTYKYDFSNDTVELLKTREIPSGFDSMQYVNKRIFARSGNVQVPITLLYKRSLFKQDGTSPLFHVARF